MTDHCDRDCPTHYAVRDLLSGHSHAPQSWRSPRLVLGVWRAGVGANRTAAFARSESELPGRLFVAVGGSEFESNPVYEPEVSLKMVSNVQKLERLLATRRYDGLDWAVPHHRSIRDRSA